jgi:hypothetical protein
MAGAGAADPLVKGAAVLALAALLGGCGPDLPPSAFAGSGPALRPEAFFAGQTRSWGVLEGRGGTPLERFRVTGHGEAEPDGTFRLDQSVAFEGKPPQTRSWLLRRVDEHRYEGSLTDASGPVRAQAYGNLLHLTYAMRSPVFGRMEQWLYLQDDGRTVLNEATVRILGVTVARVSERISHGDG